MVTISCIVDICASSIVNAGEATCREVSSAAFFSCSDDYSARGMRLLGRPEPGDPPIVSDESGAVGAGILAALMEDKALSDIRHSLGLDAHSRVLCISTEGDTDQANYQTILSCKG